MNRLSPKVDSDTQIRPFSLAGKQPLLPTAGFTIIELLMAVAIVAVLAAIAVPSYQQFMDSADNAEASADISSISPLLDRFFYDNNRYPASLAEVNADGMRDPWGNPYRYMGIMGGGFRAQMRLRKDSRLVPINSDYDLYSMGKDGRSSVPLSAPNSLDDIVRANNGRYIGTAEDY